MLGHPQTNHENNNKIINFKMKQRSFNLFLKLCLIMIFSSEFFIWTRSANAESQSYPISVYTGEQFECIPREYMIFDRIKHGVIIYHPWRFGSLVNYIAGSWKERGDTIVVTPNLLFYIWPDKGVSIDNDSICSVRSILFGDDSIYADLKFLITGRKLVDITLDYVCSSGQPTLWEYELVYGSPINKASKNYYAAYDDSVIPLNNNFPCLINDLAFNSVLSKDYTDKDSTLEYVNLPHQLITAINALAIYTQRRSVGPIH